MDNTIQQHTNPEVEFYREKARELGLESDFDSAISLVGEQVEPREVFERIARYRNYSDDAFKNLISARYGNALDAMSALKVRRVKASGSEGYEYLYKTNQSADLYATLREALADADEMVEIEIKETWEYDQASKGLGLLTHGYKNLFNFTDRSNRAEYWSYCIVAICSFLILLFAGTTWPDLEDFFTFVLVVFVLASSIGYVAISVRRLHDIGRTGWWYLIGNIPVIGLIILVWACQKGEPKRNKYGNPRARNARELNEQLVAS